MCCYLLLNNFYVEQPFVHFLLSILVGFEHLQQMQLLIFTTHVAENWNSLRKNNKCAQQYSSKLNRERNLCCQH